MTKNNVPGWILIAASDTTILFLLVSQLNFFMEKSIEWINLESYKS